MLPVGGVVPGTVCLVLTISGSYPPLGPGTSQRFLSCDSPPAPFSAGVVQSPPQGAPLETILAAADKALYRAKQSGRDRIEVVLAVP